MIPTSAAQWTMHPNDGLDALKLEQAVSPPQLGPTACFVKIAAVSLNYRDVAYATGVYPMGGKDLVVPCSDGAGTVVAVGEKVSLHQAGDKVCTLFHQGHQSGLVTPMMRQTVLGTKNDGTLREYAIFEETGLVPAPKTLSLVEAATLPCDFGLTQGTGGVSLFAAQFAFAAGATVISTTSSDDKAEALKRLGVQHTINYRTNPKWGAIARDISGGEGVHHIIEVGGNATLAQSLDAVRLEGVVSLIGFLGGNDKPSDMPGARELLTSLALIRGVNVGSKAQFVAMNDFIDKTGTRPVVDEHVFGFEQAREAYEYLLGQGHFGKVVIRVSDD